MVDLNRSTALLACDLCRRMRNSAAASSVAVGPSSPPPVCQATNASSAVSPSRFSGATFSLSSGKQRMGPVSGWKMKSRWNAAPTV